MANEQNPPVGMKFPPQINPATGRFAVSSEKDSIRESVYLILLTQQGERFLRPDFGCDLASYTFMDINVTTISLLTRTLRSRILSQEPRIRDVAVQTDRTVRDGCLMVSIDYTIREDGRNDRVVFPFYLNGETEEEPYEPQQ